MLRKTAFSVPILLVLFTSGVCQARLYDAPWPMFQRDVHHTGDVRHPGLRGKVTELPIVGLEDEIYIGSMDKNLYAVGSDGNIKWRFNAEEGIEGCPALGLDGTVYVGTVGGKLFAIDHNGEAKWSFNAG